MSNIAIDFDLVLHMQDKPIEGKKMGPPYPDAKEAMATLKDAGHHLIIWSCKSPKVTRPWLEFYKIPFSSIWGESLEDLGHKPQCSYYIDDRAVHHINWEQTMLELKNRGLNF